MSVAEQILQRLQSLPEPAQAEVLDFVEHLEARARLAAGEREDAAWAELSLSQAMRGMEDEPSPYTPADIKEAFS
ncbi:MAG: DUF2281 domain-containing protein [Planctomycetes bacterium]|nr:DUF2281 domain-containing protein [Planctomycetota bacterium]